MKDINKIDQEKIETKHNKLSDRINDELIEFQDHAYKLGYDRGFKEASAEFKLGQQVYYSVKAIKEQSPECWQGMLDAIPVIVGMSFDDYKNGGRVNFVLNDNGEVTDGYRGDHLSRFRTSAQQL